MLISALNEYYNYLSSAGKVLPEGYSLVNIEYLIELSNDGELKGIIDYREKEIEVNNKGKRKEILKPRKVIMPKRTEKPGIEGNFIEHRPLYIFGLNYSDNKLTVEDSTDKAKKSHLEFVEKNIKYIEGLNSPLINAYRKFMENWDPEDEIDNKILLGLGKNFSKSKYAFCLKGHPEKLLHDEKSVKDKWSKITEKEMQDSKFTKQCAISGKKASIARLHNKIKGVYGGQASGTVLIGFNNECDESYGNKQGKNSCISETVMEHYTEALNYLLNNKKHKVQLDDITIIFFAMGEENTYEDQIQALLFGNNEKIDSKYIDNMLSSIWESGKKGTVTEKSLACIENMNKDIDFYMFGLKPNASRLSLKFIYRKKFADILYNIALFQNDVQLSKKIHPITLWEIKRELISPKSTSDKINPALISKIMDSIIMGYNYPTALMEVLIRRIKTDRQNDIGIYREKIRIGLIKAYLKRNAKEGLNMALDTDNNNQAYLCGRLFAVLEKIQRDAAGVNLNRTIKDTYFASACSKPAIVFPTLLRLAQNHLNKINNSLFYNKLIGKIIDEIDNTFPNNLSLNDQGNFIIGYYHQMENLYTKKNKKEEDK